MREAWRQFGTWLARRAIAPGVAAAYALTIGFFLWTFSQFHIPGKGFSFLLSFGSEHEARRLEQLRGLDYYVEKASGGYDAQYYAQIAMDPSLRDPGLPQAVDNLAYRARRIFLPAVAYATGLGQPALILQSYALLNALSWLGLAAVLLHWFPPRNWNNFARWFGVLASFGLCVSVRNALTDGPSLLLIALGVLLLERGRPGWATVVLGLGGLTKETNLLSGSSLLPTTLTDRSAWLRTVVRGALVVLPLALWIIYIAAQLGSATYAGERNFDLPLVAFFKRWREVLGELPGASFSVIGAGSSFLMLVALTAQLLFLVLRPRWREAWWRIGLSFGLLMVCLGDAVWEGYPGAASRVLLPMQVAFNVLVPAGRGWWVVLVLGNLTLLSTPAVLRAPLNNGMKVNVAPGLATDGLGFKWSFPSGWHEQERGSRSYWSWTLGDAVIAVTNPHPHPVRAHLRFSLTAESVRTVEIKLNGRSSWRAEIAPKQSLAVTLGDLVLAPGENRISFETDRPGVRVGSDPRPLAFCVHNLQLDLLALEPSSSP